MYQGPLIHVSCRDLDNAVELRNMAQDAGMKFSTIRSLKLEREKAITEKRDLQERIRKIVVEIQGTERLDALIGWDRKLNADQEQLNHYHELVISLYERSQQRLSRLKELLEVS